MVIRVTIVCRQEVVMPKIGVMLSGCGVYDGSEIHEAVLTMLELDKRGCEIVLMAPDMTQLHVVNHRNGEIMAGEERNCLTESARIARGDISCLDDVDVDALDALVLPGGFGAAKNLSDFAVAGTQAVVDPDVARILRQVHQNGKPIAAICIAPAVIARALGDLNPEVTIGNDTGTAGAIEKFGGTHVNCPVDGFHVDRQNRIISTPAYMLGQRISEVHNGIANTIAELMDMI